MLEFAEWILPGHPDKISDRIADGLVDTAVALDPEALVGVEVAIHRDNVFVDGRIACPKAATINVEEIVKDVFRASNYGSTFPPDPNKLKISTDLCLGSFRAHERNIRKISDDQNIVSGYAEFNPATNYQPPANFIASTIAKCFDQARQELPRQLGSDGKVLVVIEKIYDVISRQQIICLKNVSFSIHHQPSVDTVTLISFAKKVFDQAKEIFSKLDDQESPIIATDWKTKWHEGKTEIIVNGAGDFAVGGPEGDNGLSGKKLVVDAFGPHVPIGGGAMSGKDPHKIDRIMPLRARQIAKHLVVAGLAQKALIHLAFCPGDENPRWVEIQLEKTSFQNSLTTWEPADSNSKKRWLSGYDLTIEGTFQDLQLEKIKWQELATWGHFFDPELPWERWTPGKA